MKKIILILGILVFFLGIYFNNLIKIKEQQSLAMDKSEQLNAFVQGPPPCMWEVNPPERIMSENKTQAISINTSNPGSEDCESVIFLRAPGFDVSPLKESQSFKLPNGAKGSISWILSPKKVGTFEIAVSDEIDTKIFGITVNNMLGLNALQAKVLSFLGTLFGPMLTVPWWWDRLRKRKAETKTSEGS